MFRYCREDLEPEAWLARFLPGDDPSADDYAALVSPGTLDDSLEEWEVNVKVVRVHIVTSRSLADHSRSASSRKAS